MRIPCPCCGDRDVAEFSYGGDATITPPDLDDPDCGAWHRFVYARANPRGTHEELWQHLHGCRSWLKLRRDTATHAILGAEPVGPWATAAPTKSGLTTA